MKEERNIERFFLLTVLRISIAGTLVILLSDVFFYPEDTLSIVIDVLILASGTIAYMLCEKYFTASTLIFTGTTLFTMFMQGIVEPMNITTSFSIILIVGFLFSILLHGKLLWIMHGVTVTGIMLLFVYQMLTPSLRFSETGEIISLAVTYLVLYTTISYCAGMLKFRYDHLHQYLRQVNLDLQDKTNEIEAQNEELVQAQNNLSEINLNLERIVDERTEKIREQNDILRRYNYANAHHLRGPVARLLGLVTIYRMELTPDTEFYLKKLEEQAHEIDSVIKQINLDLQTSDGKVAANGNERYVQEG